MKFYFKLSSHDLHFFSSAKFSRNYTNIFMFHPHYISIPLLSSPLSPKKTAQTFLASFVPFNNKQDVSLSRYGDRIDFSTDTWTLLLETRYKLEFTHRVVNSSNNNAYNTTTGADIDLRRPAIQNVSRSRLRVTSRFQTTCGLVSVLRFSFISIIRRTKH